MLPLRNVTWLESCLPSSSGRLSLWLRVWVPAQVLWSLGHGSNGPQYFPGHKTCFFLPCCSPPQRCRTFLTLLCPSWPEMVINPWASPVSLWVVCFSHFLKIIAISSTHLSPSAVLLGSRHPFSYLWQSVSFLRAGCHSQSQGLPMFM